MKNKKVLFIANTDRHIKLCHLPYLKMFKENGFIVHVATNTLEPIPYCDKKIRLKLKRNPFSFLNFFTSFKIRRIAREEQYDIISCHTPIGGFLGRCAVIKNKVKTKVIYTAHGFHFFKGAPWINWLIYYNVEKYLSKYTDLLLTMNEEDYQISKRNFKCECKKINGIGFDPKKLEIKDKNLRKKLGIENKYVVTYIAEISKRKNQKNFLKELNKFDLQKENIVILLVGDTTINNFEKYVKKYKNVIYVGFKENIGDYINASDLIAFPSKQEGLPLAVLEAMYFNKMIIANDIRGCRDIITNGKNGILIPNNDMHLMIQEIIKYKNKKDLPKIENDIEKYKIENVLEQVKRIYLN